MQSKKDWSIPEVSSFASGATKRRRGHERSLPSFWTPIKQCCRRDATVSKNLPGMVPYTDRYFREDDNPSDEYKPNMLFPKKRVGKLRGCPFHRKLFCLRAKSLVCYWSWRRKRKSLSMWAVVSQTINRWSAFALRRIQTKKCCCQSFIALKERSMFFVTRTSVNLFKILTATYSNSLALQCVSCIDKKDSEKQMKHPERAHHKRNSYSLI